MTRPTRCPLKRLTRAVRRWRLRRDQRAREREMIAMIESDLARWRSIKDGKP